MPSALQHWRDRRTKQNIKNKSRHIFFETLKIVVFAKYFVFKENMYYIFFVCLFFLRCIIAYYIYEEEETLRGLLSVP